MPSETTAPIGASVSDSKSSQAAVTRKNPERSLQLALAAAEVALENGATNIVVMDMAAQTANFDYFVLATGTSQRQMRAISEAIDHRLEDELRDRRMNIDGFDNSNWIVMDYGTVLIHLFDEITRQFYSIEALWADADRVDLAAHRPLLKWQ
jgi:ribosome-associated protein